MDEAVLFFCFKFQVIIYLSENENRKRRKKVDESNYRKPPERRNREVLMNILSEERTKNIHKNFEDSGNPKKMKDEKELLNPNCLQLLKS